MIKSLFLILVLPIFAYAAEGPFDGTWKVDLSSVQLPEKPQVLLLQNGMYQCSSCTPQTNIKADGTDQPTPESANGDTMSVKIVDDKTTISTIKRAGRTVASLKNTVSADGNISKLEFTNYPVASKQPVTGEETYVRIAAGPPGSHAISGSWRAQNVNQSDNSITSTFKSTADGMTMSDPTGRSCEAKFDGKDYPLKGALAGTTVSLTKVNDRSIILTTKRDGKITRVHQRTVSADGKTMYVKQENTGQGTTTTYTATKQ